MLNGLLEMHWKSLQDMSFIEFVSLLFPHLSLSHSLFPLFLSYHFFLLKNPLTPMVSANMRPFLEKGDSYVNSSSFLRMLRPWQNDLFFPLLALEHLVLLISFR